MRRLLRLATLTAVVAAAVAAVRALRRDVDPLPAPAATPSSPWPPLRDEDAAAASGAHADAAPTPDAAPAPNEPVPPEDAPAGRSWCEPVAGACPEGYPIKAKMTSKIFHSPGQLNYERTTPDRCYVDAAAAQADGLRAAKR